MPASCLMPLHAARRLALGPLLASALLVFPLPALAAEPTQITVSGTGTVAMIPDLAVVNASVETHNATNASAAIGDNEAIYERVVAAVTGLGIPRGDVTLTFYNVNYLMPPPNDRENANFGFTVNRNFAIKVRQVGLAGRVVDTAINAGVTNINGVVFGLQNTTDASNKAMALAVTDATQRAQALARDAGMHVVGIASIAFENVYTPQVNAQRVATIAAPMPPTAFDTGSANVSVTVTMVFLAKP